MKRMTIVLFLIFSTAILFYNCNDRQQSNPLVGNWAFSLPDGYPAWLSIQADTTAKMLWSVGRVKPVEVNEITRDRIAFSGKLKWQPYGGSDSYRVQNPVIGEMNSSGNLVLSVRHEFGDSSKVITLTGKRMPPVPSKPDVANLEFGPPIDLLANGMKGWKLTDPKKINGWRIENGVLINETPKTDFSGYGNYGNLRTVDEFMDFELSIDYNVPRRGNSGIYLRGAYEVQVVDRDSWMQGLNGPGAIFGRIRPKMNNARPGGEWNSYRLLLVDRHITVELNDKVVIDNQPLEGCTGGGINADDTIPGPIFLQGDHTSVKYRNIVLREVINE